MFSRCVAAFVILSAASQAQHITEEDKQAYRKRDPRALEIFRKAVAQFPDDADAHAFLGATYLDVFRSSTLMSILLTDPQTRFSEAERLEAAKSIADSAEMGQLAETELRRALAIDPNHLLALETLVSMTRPDNEERHFADIDDLRFRMQVADADESVAEINRYKEQRRRLALSSEANSIHSNIERVIAKTGAFYAMPPGPLPNPLRQALKVRFLPLIDQARADFLELLRLEASDTHAMSDLSQLLRVGAPLRDTQAEYDSEIAAADAWKRRAFDVIYPNSPAVRKSEQEQMQKIIIRVQPTAVPNISGSVRLAVTIGRDGRPVAMQPLSGNPSLFEAAKIALKQWVWEMTPVNDIPVEVETEVEVTFYQKP